MSVSKLHLFAYGAELTTLSNESIDYFGVKVDRHYDVHVSEACPSSPEVILRWYFRPFLVSVGRRRPRLSRGLVAGFGPQGRWGGLLAGPSFSPSSPSSSPLLSLAGAWSCWCVLPWALWVSRPLFSLSFEGSLWPSIPVFSRSTIGCTLPRARCSASTCSCLRVLPDCLPGLASRRSFS